MDWKEQLFYSRGAKLDLAIIFLAILLFVLSKIIWKIWGAKDWKKAWLVNTTLCLSAMLLFMVYIYLELSNRQPYLLILIIFIAFLTPVIFYRSYHWDKLLQEKKGKKEKAEVIFKLIKENAIVTIFASVVFVIILILYYWAFAK